MNLDYLYKINNQKNFKPLYYFKTGDKITDLINNSIHYIDYIHNGNFYIRGDNSDLLSTIYRNTIKFYLVREIK